MRKLLVAALAAVYVTFTLGLQSALADRPITQEYSQSVPEFPIATCDAYGFDILADAVFNFKETAFFDNDGNLNRIRVRWTLSEGSYKNSTDTTKALVFEQGWGASRWIDVQSGELVQAGLYTKVTAPGWGPLIIGAGRLVISGDGTITFLAGKADFLEGNLANLCAFLA